MKRSFGIFVITAAILALAASPAWAWYETDPSRPPVSPENCGGCHNPYFSVANAVHVGYLTTSNKCEQCHDVHAAPAGSILLLPAATIKATCFTCHDGTAGEGVYGAIAARGLTPGAQHRCETTRVIPGGDAATGGSRVETFGGLADTMSCDDCHSPHNASVVATFTGERYRNTSGGYVKWVTSKLLKRLPTGASQEATQYGSDWCGGCHKGRLSGTGLHTHPVDSLASTATPFYYERSARLATDAPTSTVAFGTLGGTNRGYLMPFPRTSQQAGHSPICQQCHEDTRFAGTLDTTGNVGDAATFTVTNSDGRTASDNPRFQNFPHETVNAAMLLEQNDDLCMNCHAVSQLP